MKNQKTNSLAIYFLTPLFIQWLVTFLVRFFAGIVGIDGTVYTSELAILIAVLIIPIAWKLFQKDKLEIENNSGKVTLKDGFRILILGVFSCIAWNVLILGAGLQEVSSGYQNVAESISQSPLWIQFFGLGVIAPIMEELLYRGILYQRMRQYVSPGIAIIFSSVVFGILHGNLVQFIFAAGLGILLAGVYEKYQNILMAFELHIAINLTSLCMTWLGGFEKIISGEMVWLFYLSIVGTAVLIWKILQKC